MRIKIKTLVISVCILIAAVVLTIFLIVPKLKELVSYIENNEKYISLGIQVQDINEEFIAEYNPPIQRKYDVLHYTINIDLLTDQKKINGDVTVKVKVNDKLSKQIELNFYNNLKIQSLTINNQPAKFDRSETNLTIFTNSTLADTSDIRITYEGRPKSLGFGSFNFLEINGTPFVYTMNEPVYASTWLPCIDLPDDKTLADIYITNDSSNVSLSNGKLIEIRTKGSKRTYHWRTIYPISTYLIAIYSGRYKSLNEKYISMSGDTLNLFYYALPDKFEDAIKDFSDHGKYIKVFEELFGNYPFVKEKYGVAEYFWEYGAMENQTITGVGSKFITGRKFFQDMFIHELAHSWWGNAVGPKTWKDIWLNEGFATYSEALYWEKQSGFDALKTTMFPKFNTFSNGTLYNPGKKLFSNLVYDKGAWVLHMLRREVGDALFFKFLRNYFKIFKYKNASTNDFKNLCEKISKIKLSYFFDQWIFKGTGIIEGEYDWETKLENGEFRTKIRLQQLQMGYDIYKFPIDINFIFDDGNEPITKKFFINKKETSLIIMTKQKPVKIILDPDKWLLAKFNKIEE